MKWLLNFIPVKSVIDFFCDFIKNKWTCRTKTPIDDIAVDKILRPALIMWWTFAIDPGIDWRQTVLSTGYLIIDFLDANGLDALEMHLKHKQDKLQGKLDEENKQN